VPPAGWPERDRVRWASGTPVRDRFDDSAP